MKSKAIPIIIAILIPIISVATALSLIYFKKSSLSGLEDFPYQTYIQEPSNLLGNRYLLKAEFEMQLANLGDEGRVVAVRAQSGDAKFAVLLPSEISENIVTRQRYAMNVRVGDGGQIIVESMQKY